MYLSRNIEERSCNHCCIGNAIIITCRECVSVALGIQYATPYCHLWPTRLYKFFPHYLTNGTIFAKKVTEHKMCVLIFCTNLSETFPILSRTERDMIRNVYRSVCKVAVIVVRL